MATPFVRLPLTKCKFMKLLAYVLCVGRRRHAFGNAAIFDCLESGQTRILNFEFLLLVGECRNLVSSTAGCVVVA